MLLTVHATVKPLVERTLRSARSSLGVNCGAALTVIIDNSIAGIVGTGCIPIEIDLGAVACCRCNEAQQANDCELHDE